ncbi:MAG: NAD(P)/FAD-dependent oxidoreductase [Dehalococcoidia bacterium]|jgi:flavin-dependent dehydrogenase
MHDVIVIGARCAGSPTAMLLARAGYGVLLVDRAMFPSDRLSTHYIQPQGVQCLRDWGLLDAVVATGAPPITKFTVFVDGQPVPMPPQADVGYCPRRILLDKILVDAAAAAGARLREGFRVESLQMEGDRVTGVIGRDREGNVAHESARFVVGAEGHHSLVAETVNAPRYRERESLTGGYYSYWSGVPADGAEVYISERGGVLAFPTNDGQLCVTAERSHDQFDAYRKDIEGTFFSILDAAPEFAARVRAGKREERWFGSADVPNFFRKPFGPGWALVGDAGYMKDPVTGFGITDAFRDAGLLATALDLALSGRAPADEALAGYQERRDAAALPIYEMTLRMAGGEFALPDLTASGQ